MVVDDSIDGGEDTVKKISNGENVTELSRKKIMKKIFQRN